MAHLARRRVTATFERERAGFGIGGRGLPALAQAARATCRLARGAAIRRGSFLTKFFAGGLFQHFTRTGGLMCQNFIKMMHTTILSSSCCCSEKIFNPTKLYENLGKRKIRSPILAWFRRFLTAAASTTTRWSTPPRSVRRM
jgi:hypothetical protein